jgi:hypothetical protein
MANEKVSQMTSLTATELVAGDFFMVVDTSARESKKISTGDILTYIEATGSFNAYHASVSDTSSYVAGSNVNGSVVSSSYSFNSVSSSWAQQTQNSINSISASYVPSGAISPTASFLLYSGVFNGSASYAISASTVNFAATSSKLLYIPGVTFNTASYALSSSNTLNSISSSYSLSSSYSISSSYSLSSSYSISSSNAITANSSSFLVNSYNPVKAWAYVTWSIGVTIPQINYNYNIASMRWLGDVDGGAGSRFSQFGVQFSNPVSTNQYIMLSNMALTFVYEPHTFLHPLYSSKSLSTFTMSIQTGISQDYFTTVSGAFPNDLYPWVSFQIIGL